MNPSSATAGQEEVQADAEAEPFDITMLMCCERDEEDRQKAIAFRQVLLSVDPSAAPRSASRNIVIAPPERDAGESDTESSDFGDDDGPGGAAAGPGSQAHELARLRDNRMRQMRAQAAEAAALRAKGAGGLVAVSESECLGVARSARAAIIHVSRTGDAACKEIDETLEALAPKHLSVRFLTVALSPGSSLPRQLGCSGAPALAVVSGGIVTGSVSLEAFGWGGEEEYREEDVDRWIRRQVGKVSSSGAGIGSDEESEGDQEESWGPVCEQCGRPGYHVHVPAVGPGECDSDG